MQKLIAVFFVAVAVGFAGCAKQSQDPAIAELPPPKPIEQLWPVPEEASQAVPAPVFLGTVPADASDKSINLAAFQADTGETYTIQPGDTLWKVATKVYGNGHRWQDIATTNRIADPTKLRIGQSLILP